jgi:DNA-binding transcriptional MerR regulator
MRPEDAGTLYNIPAELLQCYENTGLCACTEELCDCDLDRLSLLATLRDLGFSDAEAEDYLLSLLAGDRCGQLRMLNQKRGTLLEELHVRETQLDRLDYLRHELQKECKK